VEVVPVTAIGPSVDRAPTPANDARQSARWRGAAVGLAIALVIAAVESLWLAEVWIDIPVGLTGAIPAALIGAWLGPHAAGRDWRSAVWTVPALAMGVVLLSDALVVAGLVGEEVVGHHADPAVLVAVPILYIYGLVLVGLPMLVLTVPAAVAWFLSLRLWARR
jgi:hypothetical protein